MDSRERVEVALRLDKPDRVPVSAWGHSYLDEWSPERLAEVTVERVRRHAWDFVKFQPRASCFAEAFGSVYRPSGRATAGPVLVDHAVKSTDDWTRLFGSAAAPSLGDQVVAIAAVVENVGPRVPVLQTVFSPLTVAGYLVGRDEALVVRQLRERPDVVGRALSRIGEVLIEFSRRSVEAGAAGIFYAISGYASRDVMSRDEYEATVLPYDVAVLSALPGAAWFNALHLCGARIHFEVAKLLPAQVISWSIHDEGNPSLKQGLAMSGRAVMGGLAQKTTLVNGTPDELRQQAERAIAETDGRGLLLAPGCSVPPDAPEANLDAIRGAVTV